MSTVEINETELRALRLTANDAVNLAGIQRVLLGLTGEEHDEEQREDDTAARNRAFDALMTSASIMVARYGYHWPERVDISLPENEHIEPI